MNSVVCPPLLLAILVAARFPITAQAYGPLGHEIVGAIADERVWMIRGPFIIQRIEILTGSSAISGERIRQHHAQIQTYLHIIGFIIPTFPSSRRNDTATDKLAAANGT